MRFGSCSRPLWFLRDFFFGKKRELTREIPSNRIPLMTSLWRTDCPIFCGVHCLMKLILLTTAVGSDTYVLGTQHLTLIWPSEGGPRKFWVMGWMEQNFSPKPSIPLTHKRLGHTKDIFHPKAIASILTSGTSRL